MNWLKTALHWAKSAFDLITSVPGSPGRALAALWHYVAGAHNLITWLTSGPGRALARVMFGNLSVLHLYAVAVRDALHRLAVWIRDNYVTPQVKRLDRRVTALRAWAAAQFRGLLLLVLLLHRAALAYAHQLFTAEQAARVKADKAEHQQMLAQVRAALAAVQRQAATGYAAGNGDRRGLVAKLLDDLAVRNPVVKDAVSSLVKLVLDVAELENPVARFLAARLLSYVIDKSGVDAAAGRLVSALLGPLAGHGQPKTLHDVERDTAARLTALEELWAGFMADGGPEVEQAGREWKALTGIATDAALLGFVGLAVADPAAWARGVADTVGTAGNDTLVSVINLIHRA